MRKGRTRRGADTAVLLRLRPSPCKVQTTAEIAGCVANFIDAIVDTTAILASCRRVVALTTGDTNDVPDITRRLQFSSVKADMLL
jgi:hypothetical protein